MSARCGLATVVALGMIAAIPGAASARSGDSLVGSGSTFFAGDERRAAVGAHSGPLGEDPRGHLHTDWFPGFDANDPVACLRVQGNRAAAATEPRRETPNGPFISTAVGVLDNDQFPDRHILIQSGASDPQDALNIACSSALASVPVATLPVEHGNYVVRDRNP